VSARRPASRLCAGSKYRCFPRQVRAVLPAVALQYHSLTAVIL
jgi:hypothetical protein